MSRIPLLVVILFFLGAVMVYCMGGNPHDFANDQCIICHDEPLNKSGKKPTRSLTDKCLTCHQDLYENGYMHPVDMKPQKVEVAIGFPLSNKGEITCSTCHDVHSSPETPFGTKSYFLRVLEQGKAFCNTCHTPLQEGGAYGHASAFREAHFTSKYVVTSGSGEIDAMSKNCISCHDGTFASAVDIQPGSWQHSDNFLKFDGGGKHPIGANYESNRRENKGKKRLRPRNQIDSRIRFFDGKIGCGSCHNPFSRQPKKLVMPNKRSGLCKQCHEI